MVCFPQSRHPGCYGKAFAFINAGSSVGFVLFPILGGTIIESSSFLAASLGIGALLVGVASPVVPCTFGRSAVPTPAAFAKGFDCQGCRSHQHQQGTHKQLQEGSDE